MFINNNTLHRIIQNITFCISCSHFWFYNSPISFFNKTINLYTNNNIKKKPQRNKKWKSNSWILTIPSDDDDFDFPKLFSIDSWCCLICCFLIIISWTNSYPYPLSYYSLYLTLLVLIDILCLNWSISKLIIK